MDQQQVAAELDALLLAVVLAELLAGSCFLHLLLSPRLAAWKLGQRGVAANLGPGCHVPWRTPPSPSKLFFIH